MIKIGLISNKQMVKIKELNANELNSDKGCRLLVLNIIHNRFDILYDSFRLFIVDDEYLIPIFFDYKSLTLEVGLYLNKIDSKILDQFYSFLFTEYPSAMHIRVKHSMTKIPFTIPYKYWYINLPKTIEAFDQKLSSRVRYNTKWYPKKIKKELGNYSIDKFKGDSVPEFIVKHYLDWKFLSHGFSYKNTPRQFIKEFGISDVYAMKLDSSVIAVALICVTGNNVYFENFSYAPQYKNYSLGMVIYYHMIKDMIELGKSTIYLSGGELQYKKKI